MKSKYIIILFLNVIIFTSPVFIVYSDYSLSNNEAIEIIEKGRNIGYYTPIPIGIIQLRPQPLSYRNGPSYLGKNGDVFQFEYNYKNILNFFVNCGVVQYQEYFKSQKHEVGLRLLERIDGERYLVSLTETGKNMIAGYNDDGMALVKFGEIKISKISRNMEIKNSVLYGTKEYRLILGIFDFIPTEIGQKFYDAIGEKLQKQYKFRALLLYDPIKEKYRYGPFDFGYLDTDKWYSNNVKE